MDSTCDATWNYTLEPEGAFEDLHSTFDVVAIAVLMPPILCFGIVGNLSFLLMIYRVPKMRSLTNFYLANLAVSDIVFLLFGISAKIHEYRVAAVNFAPVYHGVLSCLLKLLVVDLSYFASLFMVTLVSLEKFYAICKPLRHRLINGWDRTVKLTVGSWAVSLVFATSVIPSYCAIGNLCIVWPKGEQFDDLSHQYSVCVSAEAWASAYANVLQTLPFFIAVALNTTMYVLIVRRLSQRVDQPLGLRIDAQFPDRAVQTRNQVARMLVINGAIFFFLQAPFEIVSILIPTGALTYTQHMVLLQICRLLSYLNAAINPLVYGMVNSKYRYAYREAFLLTRNNRVNPEPVASQLTGQQQISNHTAAPEACHGQDAAKQVVSQ